MTLISENYNHFYDKFSNTTSSELECTLREVNRSFFKDQHHFCNATWDGLSCWPATAANAISTISCFPELNGVLYDTTQNASRGCYSNGTWEEKSDYSSCIPLLIEEGIFQGLWDVKEASTIYFVGYSISLLAVIVALGIFLHFKNLRCLRNAIHTNLMLTYLLIDITWIITATIQSSHSYAANEVTCILILLLTYLLGTNFFWMFVEGLYLYILAVKTFSIEVVRIHVYAFIGWGLPGLFVAIWATVKAYVSGNNNPDMFILEECPWRMRDNYEYIFVCPIIIVLLVNVFFLGQIMWVLITKLRSATSAESKQYRKAAKALLVLIPLLGVTYILVLVTPSHRTARVVFTYIQAALLSSQGFTVAVLYCFLNGEVQKSLRYLWKKWTTGHSARAGSQRYSMTYRSSHYGSENTKLYRNRAIHNRDSCISFTTTTSVSNCQRYLPEI
ncbi:diuretic hormone receptor-like [Centruroides sculpturatus]|uniref:diuretic hormone receptor-like n=1 Tax=Centruroides sculpturatus TaxID=218467 RepID=UPI000C6D0103|nr:diuretic hormone receptor-like [Centruroides sculpturatus]